MASVSAADIEKLFRAAAKVDWLAIAKAVASKFKDQQADEAAEQSVEQLVATATPIVAPYLLTAVGPVLGGPIGIAAGVLIPALALAVIEFKGGDADPEVDANAYASRGGRGN